MADGLGGSGWASRGVGSIGGFAPKARSDGEIRQRLEEERTVKRELGQFLVTSAAGAVALATVFYGREGFDGLIKILVIAGLCLVPGAAALVWILWAQSRSPSQQLLATIGGMLLRMATALGGGILAYTVNSHWRNNREQALSFWVALLLLYLWTLVIETVLVSRRRRTVSVSAKRCEVA